MAAYRPLGISTALMGQLLGVDCPESALSVLADSPIRHVEYFCLEKPPRMWDDDHIRRVGEVVQAHGLVVWSVHAPFEVTDISTTDEEARRVSIANVTRALEIAQRLAAGVVVVHGSKEPVTPPERQERLVQCVRSLNDLCKRASQRGLRLALELLPRTCLGNRVAEIQWLMDIVDGDLYVCYDVNHITLYEEAGPSLRALGKRVATLHISDHDGVDERHWIPGTGAVNWPDFVAGLDEIGYTGCLMHEAVDPVLDLAGNLRAIVQAARVHLAWNEP